MADTAPNATYSVRKERRGYSTILAIDPHTGKPWDVLLSGLKIGDTQKKGLGASRELAFTVRWALQNIRHLYRGVRDDKLDLDEDEWLCYIATPPKAYDWKTGELREAWESELFLVYLTEERVVYHWGWYDCDPHDKTLPIDHENRFTDPIF